MGDICKYKPKNLTLSLNRPQYNIEEQKFTYKTEVMLTIDKFSKEDVGLYTCVSTNSLGLKESDVRVYGKLKAQKRQ